MDNYEKTNTNNKITRPNTNQSHSTPLIILSPSSSSSPPPPPALVMRSSCDAEKCVTIMSPCAACKILRRRCVEKCVLAPYFPPTEPLNFTIAHRVFGASNIIKLLQEIPESQRADAVSSMVYEANARIRDPVYGCAGTICHLQNQMIELQAELAKAQAEIVNMQSQQANLLTRICMDLSQPHQNQSFHENFNFFPDVEVSLGNVGFEPLWT